LWENNKIILNNTILQFVGKFPVGAIPMDYISNFPFIIIIIFSVGKKQAVGDQKLIN
jgi:hypothetical protein